MDVKRQGKLFQIPPQQLGMVRIVLDQQNMNLGHAHGYTPPDGAPPGDRVK